MSTMLKPFKFFITSVHELPGAGKVVVDGWFIQGVAITGDRARVEHPDNGLEFTVQGFDTSGFVKFGTNKTSLTVSRKEALAAGVREGRTIISVD